MLKIWGRISSINVRKVVLCAQMLDIPFVRMDAGLSFGVVNTPDYLALNPNALMDVQGPDHGRFTAADVVDGDARLVTTMYQRKVWCALPTAKTPFSFGFNFK